MATIYDVSDLAGVSLATVSRVMNNNAKVSEKTRKKVDDAMKQLRYRPNSIAKSLASNRTNSVGILVSELHGPFYGVLMSTIEKELRKSDIHSIIAAGHSDLEEEKEAIEFLLSRKCDALILFVESVSDKYLVELSKAGTPIVILGRTISGIKSRCISANNDQGGYSAAQLALNNGHKKIAYISGPLWKKDSQQRLAGHKRALAEHGVAFNEKLLFEGDFREGSGTKGMAHLLKLRSKFTALICGNDEMAAGAMVVATDNGLSMPGDISIMGFDNSSFCRYLTPKLSTVNYPVSEMAEMAARWVLKNVYQNQQFSIDNLLRAEVVERDSVRKI